MSKYTEEGYKVYLGEEQDHLAVRRHGAETLMPPKSCFPNPPNGLGALGRHGFLSFRQLKTGAGDPSGVHSTALVPPTTGPVPPPVFRFHCNTALAEKQQAASRTHDLHGSDCLHSRLPQAGSLEWGSCEFLYCQSLAWSLANGSQNQPSNK